MPLFQPSNITPSSFAGVGGGTIDVNDNVNITWQVNGNVPMTGFKIDIYDTANTLIKTITQSNLSVYPNDKNGNPVFYSFSSTSDTWKRYGLSNGKTYYMQITQYWNNSAAESNTVKQTSQSVFITRDKPVITITNPVGTISDISTSMAVTITQAQGDSIDWVRYKIYRVESYGNVLIEDSGIIHTALIEKDIKGLISGEAYMVSIEVQTENGVTAENSSTFNVSYDLQEVQGDFSIYQKDSASLFLNWDVSSLEKDTILGVATGDYTFKDSILSLSDNASVVWATKNGEALNIQPNYSVVFNTNATIHPNSVHDIVYNNSSRSYPLSIKSECPFQTDTTNIICLPYIGSQTYNYAYIRKLVNGERESISIHFKNDTNANAIASCVYGNRVAVITNKNSIYIFDLNGNQQGYSTLGFTPNYIYPCPNYGGFLCLYTSDGTTRRAYIKFYKGSGSIDAYYSTTHTYLYAHRRTVQISGGATPYFIVSYGNRLLYGSLNSYNFTDIVGSNPEEDGDALAVADDKFIFSGKTLYKYSTSNATVLKKFTTPYASACFSKNAKYVFCARTDKSGIDVISTESYNIVKTLSVISTVIQDASQMMCDENYINIYSHKRESADNKYYVYSLADNVVYFSNSQPLKAISFNSGNYIDVGTSYKNCYIQVNGTNIIEIPISLSLEDCVRNDSFNFPIKAGLSSKTTYLNGTTKSISYTQAPINKITAKGIQSISNIYVTNSTITDFANVNPTWNTNTVFLTNFDKNSLEAGNNGEGAIVEIYKEEVGTEIKSLVYTATEEERQLRDFGWLSNRAYKYTAYAVVNGRYTSENHFMPNEIKVCSNAYFLIEARQDDENENTYHVVNYWRFANNVEAAAVSNNNNPSFLTNFTPYRLKQPTAQMGKSGILTSLLSNAVNGEYRDTAKQMEELYNLSKSTNTLFVKDMKGNMYMATVSGAITGTSNTKTLCQETTISIPWEEIGSCEGVSIIQTAKDENWEETERNK